MAFGEVGPIPHPGLYDGIVQLINAPTLMLAGHSRYMHSNASVLNELEPPYIIGPKHRSNLDGLALTVAIMAQVEDPPRLQFLVKSELEQIPLLDKIIVACGSISVNRGAVMERSALDRSKNVLENDGVLVGFPEQRRIDTPFVDPSDLHRGMAKLSIESDAPLIPTGIDGTQKDDRGDITIFFGEPISFHDLQPHEQVSGRVARRALTLLLADRINEACVQAQSFREHFRTTL